MPHTHVIACAKNDFDHVHGVKVLIWNSKIRLAFCLRYIHASANTLYPSRSMVGIGWVREALYWSGLLGGRPRPGMVSGRLLDPETDENGYIRNTKMTSNIKPKNIVHVLRVEYCHTMCETVFDLSSRNNTVTFVSSILCRLSLDEYISPPGEIHHSGALWSNRLHVGYFFVKWVIRWVKEASNLFVWGCSWC